MHTLATDLDGTIYIEDKLIDQVKESHNELLNKGIKILYTTNNSSQNPLRIQKKLEQLLEIKIDVDSVITPLKVLSEYLRDNKFKIFTYGSDDLTEYINGISNVTVNINEADLVLIGRKENIDQKNISDIINHAKKGKKIFGMNKDLTFPTYNNKEKRGNGFVLKIIEDAVGIDINTFGKPDIFYFNYIINKFKRIEFMIGDRVDTDIVLGNNLNATTFLVNSSVKNHMKNNIPDYKFTNFSECVSFILKNFYK